MTASKKNEAPEPEPTDMAEQFAPEPSAVSDADADPYVGDTFLDLDERTENRRIRIEEVDGDEFVGMEPSRRYRYVTVSNDGNPGTVGNHGHIARLTLDERWRKVSRD